MWMYNTEENNPEVSCQQQHIPARAGLHQQPDGLKISPPDGASRISGKRQKSVSSWRNVAGQIRSASHGYSQTAPEHVFTGHHRLWWWYACTSLSFNKDGLNILNWLVEEKIDKCFEKKTH
jgi:hypothetical protein